MHGYVVIPLDGGLFDCPVHALDLPVGPGDSPLSAGVRSDGLRIHGIISTD